MGDECDQENDVPKVDILEGATPIQRFSYQVYNDDEMMGFVYDMAVKVKEGKYRNHDELKKLVEKEGRALRRAAKNHLTSCDYTIKEVHDTMDSMEMTLALLR